MSSGRRSRVDRLDAGAEGLDSRTAASTAAATSGCTLVAYPRRGEYATRRPDAVVQADEVVAGGGGSAVQSRASGRLSTFIISAASRTLRLCGPRCATVPNGDSGCAGTGRSSA